MATIKKLFSTWFGDDTQAFASGSGPLAKPVRDWTIILCASAAALLGLAAFAGVLFWQEKGGIGLQAPLEQSQTTITQSSLDALLATYQARAAEHAILMQAPSPIADPSQPK